jgi:hypothetical protein
MVEKWREESGIAQIPANGKATVQRRLGFLM